MNGLAALPIVAALGFAWWVQSPNPPAEAALVSRFRIGPGDVLPDLALVDTAGVPVSLHQILGHTPRLILVVDPDCGHCHGELRALMETVVAAPGVAAQVVLVAVGDTERAVRLAREHPRLVFHAEPGRKLRERYGLPGVPLLITLDSRGRVERVLLGAQGRDVLQHLLNGLRDA